MARPPDRLLRSRVPGAALRGRAAGPALTDLIAGQVHVLFDNLPSSIGLPGSPEDFGRVVRGEVERWAKVVQASGAKVE